MVSHTTLLKKIILYTVLSLVALFSLIPLLWMMSTSLKSDAETLSATVEWLPHIFHWENFTEVFKRTNFNLNYWNSVFVALLVTSGQAFT